MTDSFQNDNSDTKLSLNKIYNMDCLEGMKLIPDGSIDAIITDPPYWTTACKRDTVIPFDLMREQLKRIIKPNWAIVLFWSEPFSSALRMSNIKDYKYDCIWNKKNTWCPVVANKRPLPIHENISIFWQWKLCYNPQKIDTWKIREWKQYSNSWSIPITTPWTGICNWLFPKSIFEFSNADRNNRVHPTQKPVALIEYLIKTYSNEWETVLDFTMWSWTTAVACINTNRNYIWFELDEWYRNIANKRIQDRLSENSLF